MTCETCGTCGDEGERARIGQRSCHCRSCRDERTVEILRTIGRVDHRTFRQGEVMATINEVLVALADKVTGIESDVRRVLDALASEQLSPEAQAEVDALQARLDQVDADMDAAVPEVPPVS